MFVTQERAEYIVELSYKLYELKKYDSFYTLNKAMELDQNTALKVINKLESELQEELMKKEVVIYGGTVYYADDEIIEIDNYQYLDSIEYDLYDNRDILRINCKFYNGDSVSISKIDHFYAPHVYGEFIPYNSGISGPYIKEMNMRELFLKLLIVEDRLVNPYIIMEKAPFNKIINKIIFPMKEAIVKYKGFDKEIDLLNRLLKVCRGKIISAKEIGGFADIGIKPTVLYLESIGEAELANEVRQYEKEPLNLNLVLDWARKGYYGMSFSGNKTMVRLI